MNSDVSPTAASDRATDVAVAASNLSLAYGDTIAVRDATFTVPRGATTAIIGPNGSGKTTLLRAMSGLQEPISGRIEVFGAPPERRRRTVAHVMQTNTVNEAVPLTVVEVVRMGRYGALGTIRRFRDRDHEAVADAMRRMEIVDLAGRQLRELSGGQRQRVFVAQGLAQQADLLLLDEPITGLDIPSQERIDRALEEEVAAGRTVVITTHHVATAAAADHVLLMATHVVASGRAEHVLAEEHLEHAYGATTFRTAEGTLVIGDPHVHGTDLTGHDEH